MKSMNPKTPSEIWQEIKGKAHLYETALHIASGEYVKLVGCNGDGTFAVRRLNGDRECFGCHELTDYCL